METMVRTKAGRRLVDCHGASEMLDMSVKKVRAMIAARELPTVRIGRSVRVEIAALENYILENTTPARVA